MFKAKVVDAAAATNAQGRESILVANKCLYRTIILGGASGRELRATASKRVTGPWWRGTLGVAAMSRAGPAGHGPSAKT